MTTKQIATGLIVLTLLTGLFVIASLYTAESSGNINAEAQHEIIKYVR